jgi:hypothetical protein
MSDLPITKEKQFRLLLLPFKAYTVIGISFFFVWFVLINEHTRDAYHHATAFIFLGHLLAGIVLVVGGLIQRFALKSSAASWSFAFGTVNFLIVVFILPNLRSA